MAETCEHDFRNLSGVLDGPQTCRRCGCPGPAPAVPHPETREKLTAEELEAALCQSCRGLRAGHGIAFCDYHNGYNRAVAKWRQTVENREYVIQGLREELARLRSTSPQHDAPDFNAWWELSCEADPEMSWGNRVRAAWNAALASQPVHHDACGFDALRELDLIASEAVHSHCPNIANRIGIVLAALRSKADSQKEAGPHPSCDVPTLPEHHTTKADSSDALVEIVLKAFADEDALFEKQKNGGPGYAAWVEKWRDNQRRGRQWSLELAAALRSLGAKERGDGALTRQLVVDAVGALLCREHGAGAGEIADAVLALQPAPARGCICEREKISPNEPHARNCPAALLTKEREFSDEQIADAVTIYSLALSPHWGGFTPNTAAIAGFRKAVAALLDSGDKT